MRAEHFSHSGTIILLYSMRFIIDKRIFCEDNKKSRNKHTARGEKYKEIPVWQSVRQPRSATSIARHTPSATDKFFATIQPQTHPFLPVSANYGVKIIEEVIMRHISSKLRLPSNRTYRDFRTVGFSLVRNRKT